MLLRSLHVLLFTLLPITAAIAAPAPLPPDTEIATFAGGCFWCMEPPFRKLPGVISVEVGYTGGRVANPSYEDVSGGQTGHAESIEVRFHPSQLSYEKLLDTFWHNIDPTTPRRQFCDSGDQYRTAIFFHGEAQKRLAIASRDALAKTEAMQGQWIATEIVAASEFYPAEQYHQAYYRKKEVQYQSYRARCGRDQRLKQLWGDQAGGR